MRRRPRPWRRARTTARACLRLRLPWRTRDEVGLGLCGKVELKVEGNLF
jgi:hypothetical protein